MKQDEQVNISVSQFLEELGMKPFNSVGEEDYLITHFGEVFGKIDQIIHLLFTTEEINEENISIYRDKVLRSLSTNFTTKTTPIE